MLNKQSSLYHTNYLKRHYDIKCKSLCVGWQHVCNNIQNHFLKCWSADSPHMSTLLYVDTQLISLS